MTPAQVESAARNRHNSSSSSFWSSDELRKIIWEAESILARETNCIEDKDTSTTTVSGTRNYSYPSLVIGIKRIEYNGVKLSPIDFRQDDSITLSNSATTATGTPQYYSIWEDVIYLRPIPDAAQTLTLFCYKDATLLDASSSSLSTPVRCHTALINYTVAQMAAKDENWSMYDRYMALWDKDVESHRRFFQKRKRTDGFAVVKDEDSLPQTLLGTS